MTHDTDGSAPARNLPMAFGGGAVIGALGGLIGLGGAEFRLPLLIGPFRFGALEAVVLNKAMSLVVVATALIFRTRTVPLDAVATHWPIIFNLLAGSLIGAWFGAGWAVRAKSETLYRVIAVLLTIIAVVLLVGHGFAEGQPLLTGIWQLVAGIVSGLAIGVVASLLGVAGGELLIPTLILLFGADIKLAGSLSLAVSLPTMLVGFTRYSRDQSFAVLGHTTGHFCSLWPLVLNRDQELWAVALWVEKNHGDQGTTYISGQVERLTSVNDDGGVAMWREVADRFERLRSTPDAGQAS